jgi:hypothetical protein
VSDLNSLIGDILKESPDDPSVADVTDESENEESTEAETEATAEASDESEATDETEEKPEPVAYDADKVKAAIEKKDLAALIEAIGNDVAEELLGSKAHKTLRLQLRDAKNAESRAVKLTETLTNEFGDAIAARKASAEGNVDAFLDMVEKWAGRDWNDLQKWVAKGVAGRTERLEAKTKEQAEEQTKAADIQKKALEEARTWVSSTVNKAEPKLLAECPEIVDMIIDEMKAGLAKGIDSPSKALPNVKAKLKARYESMHKYFGDKRRGPKAPVVKPTTATNVSSKPMSRDELIAQILRETN